MQRGQDERTTTPLGGRTPGGDGQLNGEPAQATPGAPTNVRLMRPGGEAPRLAGMATGGAGGSAAGAAPLSSEEVELERIREILVGPHLRDHERRLRQVERSAADLRATGTPGDWRTQVEAAIERTQQSSAAHTQALHQEQAQIMALQAELARERHEREALAQQIQQAQTASGAYALMQGASGGELDPLRAEITRERQAREAQAQDAERAMAHLTARLDQEREEHEVHRREVQSLRLEQQALQAELMRERQAQEDQGTRHTQALTAVATQMNQRQTEHAGQHQQTAAELEARLEREREAHTQQVNQLEAAHGERLNAMVAAHNSHVERLHQLVADAEEALVSMQAEREHLAGLLAELGMHLVRHAASPAAARADEDSQTFLKAAAWWRRRPRG